MPVDSQQCDPRRIARFLEGELPEEAVSLLQLHLDTCEVCRKQLDDSTADEEIWQATADYLRDEPIDMEPLTVALTRSESTELTRHVTDDGVRRVVDLLAPTDDPQMLGRIGTYEIAGVIGSGGNGIVLKAHDRALNRYVAIKVLAPHLASSGAARQRFAREAQAAAAVVHENVIAIHGVDEAGGLPYLVMPYERGHSLQRRVDEYGPLGLNEILRIGMQTAAGLAAAHAQGLVHRDIKPANILLAEGVERVTITDFGLARAVDDASMTRSGIIAGTPQFMSPEQARGDSIDHRSDLFSLGSVMYTVCTGHPPFRAETSYGMLQRICQSQPRPIRETNPEMPEWLCRLIEKLHAKEPADRFASAAEVADLFSHCLAHVQQPDSQALPAGLMLEKAKWPPRNAGRFVAVLGSCLLLVVLAVALRPVRNRSPLPAGEVTPVDGSSFASEVPSAVRPMSATTEINVQWDDDISESLLDVERHVDDLEQRTNSLIGDPH